MDDDLSSHYDVIVLGTGLPECILAAAASRIGKTVLHLDKNEYYGADWATFNLDGLKKWITSKTNGESSHNTIQDDDFSHHMKEGESLYKVQPCDCIENVKEYCFINLHKPVSSSVETDSDLNPRSVSQNDNLLRCTDDGSGDGPKIPSYEEKPADEAAINENISDNNENRTKEKVELASIKVSVKTWYYEEIEQHWRKFNIDLAPKLLFAKGALVDLLISSNIARYAEFKSVTRILSYINGKLEQVPCCRSDVFSTRDVSIVEKRMLMKFLTFCSDFEKNPSEYEGFQDKTFLEFLKARKMTYSVIHYIIHAIAMVAENASTLDGLRATQCFLKSLGHYGNTPFLWTLYGSGELPQCFCRLCAVFGGVYFLKRAAEALIVNSENKCVGIITQKKRIDCSSLVAEISYLNNSTSSVASNIKYKKTSHVILFTDRSVLKSEKEQLTFFRLPPLEHCQSAVNVIELGPSSMACPNDLFIVHMFCEQDGSAEKDLQVATELLFEKNNPDEIQNATGKPNILWCVYFNSTHIETIPSERSSLENVFITSGPNSTFDSDLPVAEAKELFQMMYPEEEFLPRAPDPDEIVVEEPEVQSNPGHEDENTLNIVEDDDNGDTSKKLDKMTLDLPESRE